MNRRTRVMIISPYVGNCIEKYCVTSTNFEKKKLFLHSRSSDPDPIKTE